MSGHSKWSTIKHQKEANDQARGKIFSKLSRAITVAVREGGGETDPEVNYKLRVAIDRAKEINMPKDNIDRAISRATGRGADELKAIRFEGYGPFGVGVIIEAITDNRQRTVQEIKNLIEKGGGSIASPGAVVYNFFPKGQIIVKKETDSENQLLKLMETEGVEDLSEEEETIEVISDKDNLSSVTDLIKKSGFKIESSSLIMMPKTEIPINNPDKAKKIINFIERLEGNDDIQSVFANFDIPVDILKEIST
ncbi:MAG: YebC/PmpR family DNA-binding transcriptional regulator [Candidatus Shapirobacteria bacterium]|nr:YebC/PmpR family DNA-binding transcriptional regulator [Candidatus Shapirobacteria bacterium]